MSWYLYSLTFRLESPLHIGFHKVMHLFRTRPYLPAKPIWGALTAKLTRKLALSDYEKVGDFLKKAMRFGYFYISNGNEIFLPRYTKEGLKFGNLMQTDFEKRFMSSMASTAIESDSFTAEEGMLHEIEFVSPYTIKDGHPVFLKGLLWICEFSEGGLSIRLENNDFSIVYNNIQVKLFELIDILQVGGERKYGFGLLKLKELRKVNSKDLKDFGFPGAWEEDAGAIKITLSTEQYIWSHAKHASDLKIKGNIEPVVGRDWDSKGAGRKLSSHGLYWSPGSILLRDETFQIKDFGLWERV